MPDPLGEPSSRAIGARRWRRALAPVGLLWATGVLLLSYVAADQVSRALDFRVDDAYITFSFSKNLASGHGPVFSHGLRVEGYSNFLWMVVIAIHYVFSGVEDALGFARVVTFACLALCFVGVYRLTRRAAGPVAALASVAALVSCSDLFRAAASGLETVPFAAAILLGWCAYLSEAARRKRWSLLAFLPAALLRIDGFVPMLAVFGVQMLTSLKDRRGSAQALARWAAPPFALWAAYFLWRYAYYGLPLPTTYYAKTMVTTGNPHRGFRQAYDFVRDYGALSVLPLACFAVARGPRRAAMALGCAVTLQVAYAITVGGDWMPFNRFFLPIVPLAAVLFGWGGQAAWQMARRSHAFVRFAVATAIIAALLFSCVHMHAASIDSPQERKKLRTASSVGAHTRHNLLAVKEMMAYVVRRPGDRLVTDYAGVFSVFTDAAVIDMWGLCNADIALHGGTRGINPIYGKECAECYARLEPDYFHIGVPIVRDRESFHRFSDVLANVFQGRAIDRVIDFRRNFAAGRVIEESSGRTLWFLERRRAELPLERRSPAQGFSVDYPFEHRRAGE